jgi:hypothetical protein
MYTIDRLYISCALPWRRDWFDQADCHQGSVDCDDFGLVECSVDDRDPKGSIKLTELSEGNRSVDSYRKPRGVFQDCTNGKMAWAVKPD